MFFLECKCSWSKLIYRGLEWKHRVKQSWFYDKIACHRRYAIGADSSSSSSLRGAEPSEQCWLLYLHVSNIHPNISEVRPRRKRCRRVYIRKPAACGLKIKTGSSWSSLMFESFHQVFCVFSTWTEDVLFCSSEAESRGVWTWSVLRRDVWRVLSVQLPPTQQVASFCHNHIQTAEILLSSTYVSCLDRSFFCVEHVCSSEFSLINFFYGWK